MEPGHKRILRSLSLALRHELEGWRDESDAWHPGDLERRLAELGVWRDRPSKPLDDMPHLSSEDRKARVVVDGYLQLRAEAGVERDEGVAEFVRESAYTWANRLLALRCMEARSIIEEVILQKPAYAGRSLVHHRFLRKTPDAAAGADDGLFAVLFAEFAERAAELHAVFDPHAAAVALRPSVAALKRCVALLSGTGTVRGQEPATDEVFSAPDAFGWAYQYWNTEEKDRVFEAVRTKKGTKIEGADIIPATQLYTEPYMVKFLVQNSLGALWMGLHPDSRLCDGWEYYVRDADRAPVETSPGGRSVRNVTFLDPALGSGHFHLEAFDLLFAMYREENPALTPRALAASILNHNLFGIDLVERAVQIAVAALWMKAKDVAPDLQAADLDTFHDHLIATNIRLPRGGDHLETFLRQHPEDAPLRSALERVFRGLEHADDLGSLLQIEEPVDRELRRLKAETDAAGAAPPVQPDMFRATVVQSALPVGVENYEAWKAGALERLKTHFAQEAKAVDSARAFFGLSARKGLALFDLLARRYDIVAANPPYMGEGNFGVEFKAHLKRAYPESSGDLYACFIERNLGLSKGYTAQVTLHTWMFLTSFVRFRERLLRSCSFRTVVQLGRYAFDEADRPGNPCMAIFRVRKPEEEHMFPAFRIAQPMVATQQARLLAACENYAPRFRKILQAELLKIDDYPIALGLPNRLLDILKSPVLLGVGNAPLAEVLMGSSTKSDVRFLRWFWEANSSQARWRRFTKGGRYQKWCGLNTHVIDWESRGARPKVSVLERYAYLNGNYGWVIKYEEHHFLPGLTYTNMARGSLGVRLMDDAIPGHSSHAVYPLAESRFALMALLNSRVASVLLRVVTQSLTFETGYVARLPVVAPNALAEIGENAVRWKLALVDRDHLEFGFEYNLRERSSSLRQAVRAEIEEALVNSARLHTIESKIENQAFELYGLDEESRQFVLTETGLPCGFHPTVAGYYRILEGIPEASCEEVTRHVTESQYPQAETKLRQRLRDAFEVGPGKKESPDDSSEDETEEEGVVEGGRPIPAETFLEELSQKLELHPISVFWLLKEGIEQEGWRCLPEEKRLTEDRFTVLVLRMLGHRWPKQIEAGEPPPDWVDLDGVIPISTGSADRTLAARVLDRLGEEFRGGDPAAIRAEFEEIVGATLEAWLAVGFFARHISQFKKRPIAWQLQSKPAAQPSRRRSAPARGPLFACLVYYHRLDPDLLPKLRSHYLGGLRSAHETELRTLEGLAQPTPDQAARKAELDVLLDELNRFDAQLQSGIESGFGPASLQPRLRQFAVDDAMLAIKARWLARLGDTLQAGPLAEWQAAAIDLGQHADFPWWIADAIARLPHHCAKAGAEPPKAETLSNDPTPATLAAVICAATEAMTETALTRACAEWEREFDTHVIDPLRARISTANTALDQLAADLETLDRRNTARVEEIVREQKRMRAEVKTLKREIKDKTEEAEKLAARIRQWTSPELATWEPWLAGTPLFDEVSSLDGRRTEPATIHEFIQQESFYAPDLNDGVRVNIAPLQRAGLLAADVLAAKDLDKAIADRAEWRADERRWVREGKLPRPGWWAQPAEVVELSVPTFERSLLPPEKYAIGAVIALLQRAGGSCATMRLAGAYSLLAKRELLERTVPPEVAKLAKKWRQRSQRQEVDISFFRAALDELRERDVLIPEERDGRTFERLSAQGLALSSEEWLRVDAALALSAIDALDAVRQQPILEQYPAEERQRWIA